MEVVKYFTKGVIKTLVVSIFLMFISLIAVTVKYLLIIVARCYGLFKGKEGYTNFMLKLKYCFRFTNKFTESKVIFDKVNN